MVAHKKPNTLGLHGDSYETFINSRHFSEVTRINYTFTLRKYVDFLGGESLDGNTDRLLNDGNAKKIETQIINFLTNAADNHNASPRTLRFYYTGLKSFFTYNNITAINWIKIHKDYVGKMYKKAIDFPYTYEEIRKLLSFSNERIKALIMIMATSGIRRGAVNTLQIQDLEYLKEHNLYKLTVYRGEPEQYVTFITPEASQAVDQYLDYRKRYGEVLKSTVPLFRDEFDMLEPEKNVQTPKQMSVAFVDRNLSRLLFKSGIRNRKEMKGLRSGERHSQMASHSLRKFFKTKCIAAGMRSDISEMLMGHNIGLSDHYLRPTEQDLLEHYLHAVPHLTITEEARLAQKLDKSEADKTEMMKMAEATINQMSQKYFEAIRRIERLEHLQQQK
jgi:integrase